LTKKKEGNNKELEKTCIIFIPFVDIMTMEGDGVGGIKE